MSVALVNSGQLTLAAIDCDALPLFSSMEAPGGRCGYEPSVAAMLARSLGYTVNWYITDWDDLVPSLERGAADVVLCGQGYSPERAKAYDFTLPYAVFNETVLVRAGDQARGAADLAGYRVAAIAGSLNEKLAMTFPQVEVVRFGDSSDVMWDMLRALEAGSVDAVVDDDVVFIPIGEADARFDIAFTAATRNPWGIGVARHNQELRDRLDQTLKQVVSSHELEAAWREWMPDIAFPLADSSYEMRSFAKNLQVEVNA